MSCARRPSPPAVAETPGHKPFVGDDPGWIEAEKYVPQLGCGMDNSQRYRCYEAQRGARKTVCPDGPGLEEPYDAARQS